MQGSAGVRKHRGMETTRAEAVVLPGGREALRDTGEAIATADYDAGSDPGSIGDPRRPPIVERGGLQETIPREGAD